MGVAAWFGTLREGNVPRIDSEIKDGRRFIAVANSAIPVMRAEEMK